MQKYVVLKWIKCNASFTRYTNRIVQNDNLQLTIQFNLFYSNLCINHTFHNPFLKQNRGFKLVRTIPHYVYSEIKNSQDKKTELFIFFLKHTRVSFIYCESF